MSLSDLTADRLTGSTDDRGDEAHPDGRTAIGRSFISDDEYSGCHLSFTDPEEAIVDLFMHLKAMMQATGRT
jgi:hypothetical protein